MELDDVQPHGCKFTRIGGNGRMVDGLLFNPDEEEGDREPKRRGAATSVVDLSGDVGRFYGWPSSRIVRVSRASGGKDRHSKVLTSKGLRDRRVRLAVNTAIQFYDLQDRLGYDQPSKAVEWLLKAAATSIHELPPISGVFPGTPNQLSDEKRTTSNQLGFDSVDVDVDGSHGGGGASYFLHPQTKVTKSSACSSPSGTSEGSGLSLSRSISRIRARDRAKERIAAKERATENEASQTTSFTELLSVGLNNLIHSPIGGGNSANQSNFFQKSPRHWSSAPMDYFSNELLLGPPATSPSGHTFLSSPPHSSPLFSSAADHHQFSFVPDHLVSVTDASAVENSNEYRLNFSMSSSSPSSSGLIGFNRGTLQSNSTSPSLVSHLQRLPPIDGPPSSFFIGTTVPVENHHQFIYFGNARCNNNGMPSGHKEKEKN